MLYWTIVFSILSLISAIFGFGGISPGAETIGKILFVGFLVLAIGAAATDWRWWRGRP